MEFLLDFEKTSISTKVGKFLQENLKDEKDKVSLQNIITEKALLKNDAINLLITILQALTIPDSSENEEITVVTPVEVETEKEVEGEEGKKSGLNSSGEFPTLAQSMAKWTRAENKSKKPAQTINELLPSGSKSEG